MDTRAAPIGQPVRWMSVTLWLLGGSFSSWGLGIGLRLPKVLTRLPTFSTLSGMADIRTLSYESEGLETLRSELRYTERRFLARPETAPLAEPFQGLVARWPTLRDTQVAHWDAEDDADVAVGNFDDDADDLILPISHSLLHVLGRTNHPIYERIFGSDTPSTIQGLGLESQLLRMAEWPATLRAAGTELEAHADLVQNVLVGGRAAIEARVAANAARADHRVTEIRAFFDEVNGTRLTAYGQLLGIAASNGKPKTWATRFFRKGKKRKATDSEE